MFGTSVGRGPEVRVKPVVARRHVTVPAKPAIALTAAVRVVLL